MFEISARLEFCEDNPTLCNSLDVIKVVTTLSGEMEQVSEEVRSSNCTVRGTVKPTS